MTATIDHQLADLWREWIGNGGGPIDAREDGSRFCLCCWAWVNVQPHDPTCVYARAMALVEQEEASDE